MKGKMKAAVFYAPMDVRFEEVDIPEVKPGEVLVKIEAALTCGTDVKTYRRGHPTIIRTIPSLFGHEWSGVVVETGAGVDKFQPGMRVVAPNTAPCNQCYYCKSGRQSLCQDLVYLNGAYAQYLSIPARIVQQNTYAIPDDLDFDEAALLEPLACVVHGADRTDVRLGDTVAIIGAGPIGLMFLQLIKMRGARVIVADMSPYRLEVARNLGADATVNAGQVANLVQAVKSLTDTGYGPDVVIEAIGLPETWQQAVEMARPGGLVNLFGGCKSGTQFSIDTSRIHYDEVRVMGVYHHTPRHVRIARDLLARHQIKTRALITSRTPLEGVIDALTMPNDAKIKVAVIPW
jgi:L-iditol 2-dehydrogenase